MLYHLVVLVDQGPSCLAAASTLPALGWGLGLYALGLLSALGYVAMRSPGRLRPQTAMAAPVTKEAATPPIPRPPEPASNLHKLETIGRLASGVAHDLNNVVTVILGYSELLQRHVPGNTQAEGLVVEIRRSGERAAGLIRQLLCFSRSKPPAPCTLDLNAVVRDTAGMLERLIGEDIELTVRLTPEPLAVTMDVTQLEQVLVNLIVNARDAMPGGGKLSIETQLVRAADGRTQNAAGVSPHALLLVRDTGCGMSAGVQERIFEPFFTTKDAGKGTGLGLATVKEIVTANSGWITVDSEPNHGSTFRVCLTLAATSPTCRAADPAPAIAGGRGLTVLLAEDDDYLRVLVKNVLTHRGYQVLEARACQEALQLAAAHDGPIHLLLSDVIMPQMSGRELAGELAQTQPGMRVLYMSGYPPEAVGRHGVHEEEVAFLQKPFTSTALEAKIQEVLQHVAAEVV